MAEQLSMFSNKTQSNAKLSDKPSTKTSAKPSEDLEDTTISAEGDSQQPSKSETDNSAVDEYEALDHQLAALMLELNDYTPELDDDRKALNQTLKYCTLEISKKTREGQIAKHISTEQKDIIMQATVVGEAGDYMPLIVTDEIDESDESTHKKHYLYLNRYWDYQQRLAEQIKSRIGSQQELKQAPGEELNEQHSQQLSQTQWAKQRLQDYFAEDQNSSEINWQKRAAESALNNHFLIVSGGPGTGKTTTITRILALLIEQHLWEHSNEAKTPSPENDETIQTSKKGGGVFSQSFKVLLAAPTGKAAIRMLDSIRDVSQSLYTELGTELGLDENVLAHMPTQASTLHKLLGYKPNSAQFKHNKNNPLQADVVLVDEASMIDIALMTKLIEAVPAHAKLILIGDKDQLSSVETGSVFADMCQGLGADETQQTSLVTLQKNWRFAKDSDIGQCAIASNQGDSKTLLKVLNDTNRTDAERISPSKMRDADIVKPWTNYFKVVNNPNSSLSEIFDAFNQYRVLCALRRGINGSETMNSRIETALEKQDNISRRRGDYKQGMQQSSWYHGRPIMITQNDYSRGLFNGDTGITLIRDGEIKVYFANTKTENETEVENTDKTTEPTDTSYTSYTPIRLPAHETTWAMTIHKSQGSEFEQVLLILPQEEMPLLTRQLVYTGITRAKKHVSIVASEAVLVAGVKAEVVRATRIMKNLKSAKKVGGVF